MKKILANGNIILSSEEKLEMIKNVSELYHKILEEFKFDVDNDQQIKDTPKRWAKMMVNELLQGCFTEAPKITVFDNTENYDQMIFLGPIELKSLCSHHFKSFIGSAYVAYVPDKKIVGISKLARIVKWYMRRPQIQEELTKQIANHIQEILQPKGCAVYIEASHLCMIARGVEEKQNATMKTSELKGCFKDLDARTEFFNMISLSKKS